MGIVFFAIALCSTLAAARAGGLTGGYGLSFGGGYGIGYGVSGVGSSVALHHEGPDFLKAAPGPAHLVGPAHHLEKLDVGRTVIIHSILGGNGGLSRDRVLGNGGGEGPAYGHTRLKWPKMKT